MSLQDCLYERLVLPEGLFDLLVVFLSVSSRSRFPHSISERLVLLAIFAEFSERLVSLATFSYDSFCHRYRLLGLINIFDIRYIGLDWSLY